MDKKQLLLFILLAVGLSLLLSRVFAPKPSAAPPAVGATAGDANQWNYGGAPLALADARAGRIDRLRLGSLDPRDDYRLQVEIDPRGASVYTAKLTGYYRKVEQKRKKNKTPEELQAYSYPLLNPVVDGEQVFLPLGTRSLRVDDGVRTLDIPVFQGAVDRLAPAGDPQGRPVPSRIVWWSGQGVRTDEDGTQSVTYTLEIYSSKQAASPDYRLSKTYRLARRSRSLQMSLKVENLTGRNRRLAVVQNGPGGMPRDDISRDYRGALSGRYDDDSGAIGVPRVIEREALQGQVRKEQRFPGQQEWLGANLPAGAYEEYLKKVTFPADRQRIVDVARRQGADDSVVFAFSRLSKDKPYEGADQVRKELAGMTAPVAWAGQINKFFAALMAPRVPGQTVGPQTATGSLVVPSEQYTYTFRAEVLREEPDSVVPGVVFQSDPRIMGSVVGAGAAAGEPPGGPDQGVLEFTYDVYLGPKDRQLFEDVPLYNKLNYKEAVRFYSCQRFWVPELATGVIWLIQRGGRLMGNYGIVIIILVLFIRALLHPITKRSQVSMMRMQKLGPKMKEIQEKYKDDKAAQQKAMSEFFRQTGATPFLGCLPMFLQMPIWMALYAGLQATVSLRHEGLLPFWITDLSSPDTVLHWSPFRVPLFGVWVAGLNLLPILLAVAMVLQQKLMPMQASPTTTPEQQRQQKLMMYMMPVMMLLIFYNAPSGLTLYVMASTAAGVLEAHVIRKHIRQREAAEAAAETRVALPGWVPRGKRSKKPKGPKGF